MWASAAACSRAYFSASRADTAAVSATEQRRIASCRSATSLSTRPLS